MKTQTDKQALQDLRQAWADLQQAMDLLEQDGVPYPERAKLENTMRQLMDRYGAGCPNLPWQAAKHQ